MTENKNSFDSNFVKKLSQKYNIDISNYSLKELTMGYNIELEHSDVTKGNHVSTLKIAIAHLKEVPNYYTRLIKFVEKD